MNSFIRVAEDFYDLNNFTINVIRFLYLEDINIKGINKSENKNVVCVYELPYTESIEISFSHYMSFKNSILEKFEELSLDEDKEAEVSLILVHVITKKLVLPQDDKIYFGFIHNDKISNIDGFEIIN